MPLAAQVAGWSRRRRHAGACRVLALLGGAFVAQPFAHSNAAAAAPLDLSRVDALQAQGHLDDAQQAAEALWRASADGDALPWLELLRRLAELAMLQDDDVSGRRWIDAWVEGHRVTGAPPDEAMRLELEGRLARVSGRYEDARVAFERLLELRRGQPPPGARLASALDARADVERISGRYRQAEELAREAVAVIRAVELADATARTRYEARLAQIRLDLDDAPQARAGFQEALDFARGALGAHHPTVAMVHQYIGNERLKAGAYDEAAAAFEDAQEILDTFPDRGYLVERATLAHNRGCLAASLGDVTRAREQFERAIDLWQRAKGVRHPHAAWTYQALGELEARQGRDREALELFLRAVELRRERQPGSTVLAESLAAVARSNALLGRCVAALELGREALEMSASASAGRETIERRSDRARVEAACGRTAAARRHFEQALALARARLGVDHPLVHDLRAGLAEVRLAQGAARDALRLALAAAAAQVRLARRILAYLPEADGLNYAARVRATRDLAVRALLRSRPTRADTQAILDLLVDGRSLVEDVVARRALSQRRARDPEQLALLRKLEELRARYAATSWRSLGDAAAKTAQHLKALGDELERVETTAARAFGESADRATLRSTALQAALPRDTALVAFVRASGPSGDARPASGAYVALVVRPGRPVAFVRLGPAARLDRTLAAWRAALDPADRPPRPSARRLASDELRARSAGHVVAQALWRPLTAHLRGARRVLLVPDGPLALVPFGALPLARGYLVEAGWTLHLLGSERELLRPAPRRQGTALVALGDASYASTARVADADRSARGRWLALAETAEELRLLAERWHASRPDVPVVVLSHEQASEAALRAHAPRARVLHLATHAFFSPSSGGQAGGERYPLARSGLVLAGLETASAGADDGILTALELAALDLDGCGLAVLSACGSALGAVQDGEGVLGLRRALLVAGVRTIVMSLMRVEDEAARCFMDELYRAWLVDGAAPDDAMRAATLARLRALRAAGRSTPPYEWGAFVAAGDWR